MQGVAPSGRARLKARARVRTEADAEGWIKGLLCDVENTCYMCQGHRGRAALAPG